jgi:chemotaxis protein MotB
MVRPIFKEGLMHRSNWLMIAVAIVALPLASCVSRGKYDEVVADNEALRARTIELSRNSAELADVAAGLSEELQLRDRDLDQLEQERQELSDDFDKWIVAGLIQMSLLADGLHLVLNEDVLFTSGSADLKDEGREALHLLVVELEGVPYEIAVLGYSDNMPIGVELAQRYPSNWELAGARAAAVVRMLQTEGISPEQLVAVSFGESHPIATNDTPEGRKTNRRIEIRLRPIVRTAVS